MPRSLAVAQDTILDPKSIVVSHNYTIRPNLLNEFRFGYNMQTTDITYPQFPDGAKLIGDLGLQQLGPFPKGSAYPYFEFDGSSGITTLGGSREELLHEHKYQWADNLTWIRGRHTMKFGFDVRAMRLSDYESFAGPDNFGSYFFSGEFSGSDFADFLLGLPNRTVVVNAGPDFNGFDRAYGFFAQDSIKVGSEAHRQCRRAIRVSSAFPRQQLADHKFRSHKRSSDRPQRQIVGLGNPRLSAIDQRL